MKWLIYILAFLMLSCSKEETNLVRFSGAFATAHMEFGDASYVEIDINGMTIRKDVHYVPHGMRSEFFEVPMGWNEVTRVEVFSLDEKITHYAKPLDELGSMDGLVITGVPFRTKGNVIQQMFEK